MTTTNAKTTAGPGNYSAPTESALLGPLPLVLEFLVTPSGAAAIMGEEAKPNRETPPTYKFRVTINWQGITAHRLGTNEFGDPSWNGADRYDDVAAVLVSGLMLNRQNVITIGLRRLADLAVSDDLCRCDARETPNGGRIIDLGTI